jgi:hypothetical protein
MAYTAVCRHISHDVHSLNFDDLATRASCFESTTFRKVTDTVTHCTGTELRLPKFDNISTRNTSTLLDYCVYC